MISIVACNGSMEFVVRDVFNELGENGSTVRDSFSVESLRVASTVFRPLCIDRVELVRLFKMLNRTALSRDCKLDFARRSPI
jgi:hypothetical protein